MFGLARGAGEYATLANDIFHADTLAGGADAAWQGIGKGARLLVTGGAAEGLVPREAHVVEQAPPELDLPLRHRVVGGDARTRKARREPPLVVGHRGRRRAWPSDRRSRTGDRDARPDQHDDSRQPQRVRA
jgi:hypothetical protein